MLKTFTRADGKSIWINPAFVRAVEPYSGDPKAVVHYSNGDFVLLLDDHAAVGKVLSEA